MGPPDLLQEFLAEAHRLAIGRTRASLFLNGEAGDRQPHGGQFLAYLDCGHGLAAEPNKDSRGDVGVDRKLLQHAA